ncbi:MAG: STAS domain-containing protein [Hoeflea sp.]|uniref:STAS domain-containing protein n=1 Tax=Hoeflea sp. TaxID=1940281 RepID=UPI0027300E9F|nr:STAS domain-containing protein [Hoeflea sp.]MDP2119370.1 STAS domain-containing protein [Hoeflea sp.]MDP3526166.1 STAS domain-containing protein [Hoeflea sp.]MDZ7601183.1 STAS domain-containing protein [Hoeflea sp.]
MSSTDAAPKTLKLPEVLDLNAASRLHEQVLAHKGEDIDIDATDVSRVGAQCVQVLLAAAVSWRADDQSLKVKQASDAFIKTLQLLGISDEALLPKEMLK